MPRRGALIVIAALVVSSLATFAQAQTSPTPCGAGAGSLGGAVRVELDSFNATSVKVLAIRGDPPTCTQPPVGFASDQQGALAGQGALWTLASIDASAPYHAFAFVDLNANGMPDEGEPASPHATSLDASATPNNITLVIPSATQGNQTPPPEGNQTSPPPSNQTSPPPGNETSPPPSNQTSPPPGNETSPPPSNQTSPPPGNETSPPPSNQTSPPPGNETSPPPSNQTSPPPGNETSPPPSNQTSPPPGNQTYPPPGNQTYPSPGNESYPSPGGETYPPPGGETAPPPGGGWGYQPPTDFHGGTVNGTILVGSDPAVGVRINLFVAMEPGAMWTSCEGYDTWQQRLGSCGGYAETNDTGFFTITGLADGTYDMNVDGYSAGIPNRMYQAAVRIAGATFDNVLEVRYDLAFDPPAYIEGYITRSSDGEPVGGAQVNAWPQCEPGSPCQGGWNETGANGHYRMAVQPGEYGMNVQTGWSYVGPPLAQARVDCGPFPGSSCVRVNTSSTAWHNFTLDAGAVITGRAVDGEGNPVRAFINANSFSPNGPGQSGWGQTDMTDDWSASTGYFNVTVEPGTYEVRVEPDRWWHADLTTYTNSSVVVSEGGSTDLGTIQLGAGARIVGYVTRSDGTPVTYTNVNANVHVTQGRPMGPGGFGGWGFTNDTGYYAITGLQNEVYDINIQPGWGSDFMSTTIYNVRAVSGTTTWRNTTVSEGGTLAGYVTDSSGLPIAGAWVDAWYQQEIVQGGSMEGPAGDNGGSPSAAGCDAAVDAGELTISGTYTYAGEQVGDVLVVVFRDGCMDGEPTIGTTEGDWRAGNFTVSNLSAGRYALGMILDTDANRDFQMTEPLASYAGEETPSFMTIFDLNESATGRELVLRDPPAEGWAFDEGGGGSGPDAGPGGMPGFGPAPPGGPGGAPMCESGCWGNAMTDANGYYTLRGLSNGTFGMNVRPPYNTAYGSVHLDAWRDTLPEVVIGETTFRNFTLAAGGTITGCVDAPDGSAVAWAWVSAFSPAAGFGGGEPTGYDGCFTIRGATPGTYDVEINPPWGVDYVRTRVEGVVVAAEQTTNLGDISMRTGIVFSGRVVDGDGAGVANAWINAFEKSTDGQPGAFGFGMTDETGAFRLGGLEAGTYGVQVQPPWGTGFSSKFIQELEIGASGRSDYTITLGTGGWITGRVVYGDADTPLANAWVGAWSWNGGSGSGTMTNATGWFNLTGLGAATDYNLDIMPPWDRQDLAGYHAFPVSVNESQGTLAGSAGVVRLELGGTLIGRVVDADGAGVAWAYINVHSATGFGWGMTDSEGNFSVPGLRATTGATIEVSIQPPQGAAAVSTSVDHVWAPDADGVSDAGEIALGTGKTLTGVVLDGAGSPVADANVDLWPSLPYYGPPIGGSTTTDSTGAYTITGLAVGTYDVSIRPTNGIAGVFTESAVTIVSGDTTVWYNRSLSAGGTLSVLVLSGGSPIASAQVDCFNPANYVGRGGSTDALGYANFTGVPEGALDCKAFAPGYLPAAADATVASGQTTSVSIELTTVSSATIVGTFTTSNASGAGDRFVIVVPADGNVDATDTTGFDTTADDGSSRIEGLPPGEYIVKVLDSSGREVDSTNVTLGDGAEVTVALEETS